MDYDVEGWIGAGRYERSDERLTRRNGFRGRSYDTRLGTLELKIPKLRKGSYLSRVRPPSGRWSRSFRRRGFKASRRARSMIWSKRWGGRLLRNRLEMDGISKSQVSSLCKDIDQRVVSFLNRPLEGDWPMSGSMRPMLRPSLPCPTPLIVTRESKTASPRIGNSAPLWTGTRLPDEQQWVWRVARPACVGDENIETQCSKVVCEGV